MTVFARGRLATVALLCLCGLALAAMPARVRAQAANPLLTIHGFGVANNGQASYVVVVANLGGGAAAGVVVDFTLPSGAGLHQAQTTQGSCTGLVCQLGNVLPGVPVQISLLTSFGSGSLIVDANFNGGSASAPIAGVNGPPTSNTVTSGGAITPATPSMPSTPANPSGTTNAASQPQLLISNCAGAGPSFVIVRQSGYALLVANGQGSPPLQCLPPGCSTLTLSLQPGLRTSDIIGAVEGTTVTGIWQYDTVAGRWRALYFAASAAPLDAAPLEPGIGQYTICVSSPGSIVSR